MNNQVLIDRDKLQGLLWYADRLLEDVNAGARYAGSTAPDAVHSDSDYLALYALLQSPAPEGGQLTTDNLWAASKLCGVALMPVSQHRAIVAGLAGNGWIACSERLPEEKGFVLARSGQDSDISIGTIIVYYSHLDGKFHSTHYATAVHCTHWQPLPPSPKEGGL